MMPDNEHVVETITYALQLDIENILETSSRKLCHFSLVFVTTMKAQILRN